MISTPIWWYFICIAWQRVPTKERNWPVHVKTWIDPSQRSQQPSLTVIQSSYCSKLLAGSISGTLKDFWIVRISQGSCYSSLYMIGCSLMNPTIVRTHFGSFVLVTLVWPHSFNKVRVASNHSVFPSCQDSVLPCHRSVLLSLLLGS